MTNADHLRTASDWLRSARHVAIFTGAGMSAESGIATFRDSSGVWERYPVEDFGNLRGLLRVAAEPDWSRAVDTAASCDLMLAVGTSGEVMPAAGLPHEAAANGAKVIRIDPQPGFGDLWLTGTAASMLPALLEAAFGEDTHEK